MAGPEIRAIRHSTKTWTKRARTALKESGLLKILQLDQKTGSDRE